MENTITNNRKAGFWVRFAAIWLDTLIICLLVNAATIILEQFGVLDNFEYLLAIGFIAYLVIFIGAKGRTIGKLLCGLTVQQINHKPTGYWRQFLREVAGKFIAAVFLLLGFLWAGFSPSKRGWHDYIARTEVIQDNKALKRGRLTLTAVLAINLLLISSGIAFSIVNFINLQKKNVLKPGSINVNNLTRSDYEPFVTYLKTNGKPPTEYIVEKFKQHDVVMLGEQHEVREVCEFISNLIKPLYHRANVRCFAMECLKYKNRHLGNQLVTGEKYDEKLALRLFRDCGWPTWGFREYMDILKAIWQVNRRIPSGMQKIKVVCLDSDWDGSVIGSGRKLWRLPGVFYRMARRDKFMAKVIDREVLRKGEKALVQIGYNHTYTHYRRPGVTNGKLVAEVAPGFGYILHQKYQNTVFQVVLHKWSISSDYPFENAEAQQPLGGSLEKVFAENGNKPVGFDVAGSPFADLRDSNDYFFAYQKYVVFSDIAQGYVFLNPLNELNKITWSKGFINEDNFERARATALKRGWITPEQCRTPAKLDEKLKRIFEN